MGGNYGAEDSLAQGAWEYISKPASPAIIRESLTSALEYRRGKTPPTAGGGEETPERDYGIVGHSPPMVSQPFFHNIFSQCLRTPLTLMPNSSAICL